MKQLQIYDKAGEQWLPFCDESDPAFENAAEGLEKQNHQTRTVNMAAVVLPPDVQRRVDHIAKNFDPKAEITHASQKGILIRFTKPAFALSPSKEIFEHQVEVWGNIISWEGELIGAGKYVTEETIFIEDNF